MERLWTPWRGTYVAATERVPGCFLCETPQETNDVDNLLLYRGVTAFVLMNLYPYNTGHLLIVPYAHTADFPGLPRETANEMMALAQRSVGILRAEYRPDGFNTGMNLGALAGAGEADHLHIHIVPRWGGDTNFMSALADTKVLPETLKRTHGRLHPRFVAAG